MTKTSDSRSNAVRERARKTMAVAIALGATAGFGMTGCPEDHQSGADGTGTGGGGPPTCFDAYPWEIQSAPEFRNVVTGMPKPTSWGSTETFTSVAYGHIDTVASTAGCCMDYALASEDRSEILVYRGVGNAGLRAFASATPITRDIGTGTVIDIALADLDDDDRNDLIALTSESELEIWMGNGTKGTGYFATSSTEIPATHGMAATGHSQIVIADLDCDDVPDVAMPADDGVVIRFSSTGLLDGSQQRFAGVLVREIAIGDFDDNGSPDIVAGTDNGDIRVILNGAGGSCGVFGAVETHPLADTPFSPIGLNVSVGEVCPGHPGDAAIVVAWGAKVKALCGDGSGTFGDIVEPHGEQDFEFDYVWSLAASGDKIRDVAIFPGHPEVFALANAEDAGENVFMLAPGACGLLADNPTAGEDPFLSRKRIRPLSHPFDQSGGAGYSRLALQPETAAATTWHRALVVGNRGFYVLQ